MSTIILPAAPTQAQSVSDTIRAAFPFTVDAYRLNGPDNMRTPWYGLFRSDTGAPVGPGSVSGRYTPHTVTQVCEVMEAAQTAFDGDVSLSCAFHDGHDVVMNPTKAERLAVFGTKDNIFPRVIVHAGYDGTGFRASLGFYRDACRNLARMQKVSAGCSVVIRHTSIMATRIDRLVSAFQQLRGAWGNIAQTVAQMERTPCNLMEFLARVYEESPTEKKSTRAQKRDSKIVYRLMNERRTTDRPPMGLDRIVSVWEAFNAVQGYHQHDQPRKEFKGGPLDRALLALADPAVSRAESVALALMV